MEESDPSKHYELGKRILIDDFCKDLPAVISAVKLEMYRYCAQESSRFVTAAKPIPDVWKERIDALPQPTAEDPGVTTSAYVGVKFLSLHMEALHLLTNSDRESAWSQDYASLKKQFEALHRLGQSALAKDGKNPAPRSITEQTCKAIMQDITSLEKLVEGQSRRMASQKRETNGAATSPPADATGTVAQTAPVTKTFTVTSDARANQTGNVATHRGESTVTVRGDDGVFIVQYYYDWPSSYLISAGRGKTLEGRSVSIQFDGERATYISCGAGNGKCQIKSFSRR